MNILIRKAKPEDAAKCLQYMHELLAEKNLCIPTTPKEFKYTLKEEKKTIKRYNASKNSIFIVAMNNSRMAGILTSDGGGWKANEHVTLFGMSVHKDYRNKGVGEKLLRFLIAWARKTRLIKRIELNVYERNKPAIHLYKKLGFKHEGKRLKVFYQNHKFENDLIMALYL
jgi:ribosomal protein S18 acetylase RimI-like enzyme